MNYVNCFVAGMCFSMTIEYITDGKAGRAALGVLFMLVNLFFAAANS